MVFIQGLGMSPFSHCIYSSSAGRSLGAEADADSMTGFEDECDA